MKNTPRDKEKMMREATHMTRPPRLKSVVQRAVQKLSRKKKKQ